MRIMLNNRHEELATSGPLTIAGLLALKNYSFPNIVVKVNGVLVRKDAYPATPVAEGDRVEMIHMVSGG
jgi:thiamine biosynthesis protein ThiS